MRARFFVAAAFAVGLAACQTTGGQQSARVSDNAAIQQIFSGNTLEVSGVMGSASFEWWGYYDASGAARGTMNASATSADPNGVGTWTVENGLFCSHWQHSTWGDGEKTCYEVYKSGNSIEIIRVSGGGDPSYDGKILPGNPKDL